MFLDSIALWPDRPEAELRSQHESLRQQIPLMYMLMSINVAFLSIVMRGDVPALLSLGAPAALVVLATLRATMWLWRRHADLTVTRIRRQLRGTMVMAALLSLLFGGWGFLLFSAADPSRSTAVALYVFVGSISCCYCLQALPGAARLVLLLGAAPVTVRMLLSRDWYLAGIGLTFVLVAGLILLTLAGTRAAFEEILRSRSEMSALVAALQRSQEHHRYSVELNPQIPWISDPSGATVEFSPRWSAYTGIPVEQALGHGWTAAVHPDDLPSLLELWSEVLASGDGTSADIRYRLRHHDGSFRWFRARANPRRDADGTIVSWYGNLEDIHDQVAAERALRESEERYRLASRATKDIIWDWSPLTGAIQWAGDFATVLGYREAAPGTSIDWWMEHIHPEDLADVLALYRRVIDNRQDSWSHEHRFRSVDGSYRHIFSRGYAIRDQAGTAIRAIGAMSDITLAKRAEEDLRWAAYHDPLTGLPNRKLAAEELERALQRASAESKCVGVLVVDVDSFKSINDSLGHAAGDAVLKAVALRLQGNVPRGATVARLGGDEFAVILPDLVPADASAATVHGILNGVGEALRIEESVIDVSLSAGAAMWPIDGATAEDVMKSADVALYVAKAEGSGSVRGFTPAMRDRIEDRNRMLRDAREALHDDHVIPFYQPKVALGSGEIVGFEALLRWHHHRNGLQPPAAIAAAFEDSALATQLTDRMIDRVLADMAGWLDEGHSFGRIAINGSPADFRRDDFVDRLLIRCRNVGISPSLLELEVTETVFLEQLADSVERAFRTLRAEGVTIALDDFGTGYASLTHLQQFPVNVLKIDRSFISKLDGTDGPDRAIVQGVIDIARRMNIETVAEGIENEVQERDLRALGCDIGQGFLFSRAMAADRVPLFIASRAGREVREAGSEKIAPGIGLATGRTWAART
jgi:diguanylate cyclase (GGDEF)-like protein/PAS domain S-box-containing protein